MPDALIARATNRPAPRCCFCRTACPRPSPAWWPPASRCGHASPRRLPTRPRTPEHTDAPRQPSPPRDLLGSGPLGALLDCCGPSRSTWKRQPHTAHRSTCAERPCFCLFRPQVWVLTGDKVETAISIAFSCRLFTEGMAIVELRDRDFERALAAAGVQRSAQSGGVGGGGPGVSRAGSAALSAADVGVVVDEEEGGEAAQVGTMEQIVDVEAQVRLGGGWEVQCRVACVAVGTCAMDSRGAGEGASRWWGGAVRCVWRWVHVRWTCRGAGEVGRDASSLDPCLLASHLIIIATLSTLPWTGRLCALRPPRSESQALHHAFAPDGCAATATVARGRLSCVRRRPLTCCLAGLPPEDRRGVRREHQDGVRGQDGLVRACLSALHDDAAGRSARRAGLVPRGPGGGGRRAAGRPAEGARGPAGGAVRHVPSRRLLQVGWSRRAGNSSVAVAVLTGVDTAPSWPHERLTMCLVCGATESRCLDPAVAAQAPLPCMRADTHVRAGCRPSRRRPSRAWCRRSAAP